MQGLIENILMNELPTNNYEYGFADLNNLLSSDFKNFQYGISIIRKLDVKITDEIIKGPTLDYFNHYNAINKELNEKVKIIGENLKLNGIENLGIKSTVVDNELDDDYYQTLRLNFSHKMVATRSGLGWIGKTDLFISKKYGPRLRLASILINTKVNSKYKPIDESLCGSCNNCVDSCPPKAANGILWNIKVDRDDFFNPFKCRENCRKLSKEKINIDISLCGICISVCPQGRKNSD